MQALLKDPVPPGCMPIASPLLALSIHELAPRILPAGWTPLKGTETQLWFGQGMLQVCMSVDRELDGRAWLHVSMSRPNRLPSWEDIRTVKSLFVGDDRTALQVLPPKAKHVNQHPYCMHLFSCLDGDVTPDFTRGRGSL